MILRRQWKLILGVLALYFVTVYFYLVWQPAWYHADFQVVLESQRSGRQEIREIMGGMWEEETIENAMNLVRSTEILELLLRTTRPKYWESIKVNPVERYRRINETMEPRVRTKKINNRSFSVTCFDPEPGQARDFCHNLSDLFVKYTLDRRQEKKRRYRNRLFSRLRLIKKFLEKASAEFELLKKRDEKLASLKANEKNRDNILKKKAGVQEAIDGILLSFDSEIKNLNSVKEELDKNFLDEWPDLKAVKKRLKMLVAIKKADTRPSLKGPDYIDADPVWIARKDQEFAKRIEAKELNDQLLAANLDIEKDKKAYEEAEVEIRKKRAEMPVPDDIELPGEEDEPETPKNKEKDNGGESEKPGPAPDTEADKPAEKEAEEKKTAAVKEPAGPAEPGEEERTVSGHVAAEEMKEELLWKNTLYELDNSTNHPNFNRQRISEKVSTLKSYASQIQGDLSKIESVLETESSPYTIMNRMPFARRATITETQPLIMLIFIAVFISVGIAVLMEYLRGIPASELLIERVSGIEVLEVIPDMLRAAAHQGREITAADLPILCHLGFLPGISDRFRIIKAKLLLKLNNPSKLSLIITSCGPQEGKSTCAGNIAVAFAEMGYKTLLCSCNLRRPTLEKSLQVSDSQGMSEILAGEVAWQELVHTTEIFNLYLIPSGSIPRDSSKLIFTKEFRSFFEDAKKMFDVVILDTPPILMVVDAMILSRMVDGMVLVYAPEKTPVEALNMVKKQVADINIPILGIVVNWFEDKQSEGGFFGRLKSYGYGGRGYGLGYRGGYGYGYGKGYGHRIEQTDGASAQPPPGKGAE